MTRHESHFTGRGEHENFEIMPDISGDRRWTFETVEKKEILFKHYVEGMIMKSYEKDLVSLGIYEDSLDDFRDALLDSIFSERDREIFFTLPYEIRLKVFRANLPEDVTNISAEDWKRFIRDVIDIFSEYEPHLGFHMSPHVIKKSKSNTTDREEWTITGTEQDHRNGNQPMAYYSLSLSKLFKRKRDSKFLYIVRALLKEGNNHYPDNDGHWGRSGSLSIIDVIDLGEKDINSFISDMEHNIDAISESKINP